MGNEVESIHQQDENLKSTINNMRSIKKRGESFIDNQTDIFDVRAELKWRKNLLDALKKEAQKNKRSKKDQIYSDLDQIIRNIKENSFVKAVFVFNSFASTKFEGKNVLKQTFATKIMDEHKSERVRIQVDPIHWAGNGIDSTSTQSLHSNESSFAKTAVQTKNKDAIKRNLQKTLAKEINQQYHPIRAIKNSFIMLLKMKYRTQLDEKYPSTKEQREQMLDSIHQDIDFYCCFVASGCEIYKNWIIQHGGIKETRYLDFTKRIVRKGLFNGSSFSQQIFPLVKQICCKEVSKLVEKLPSQVDISKFDIKEELAIEGAFMNSIMTLSDFDRIESPNISMQKLQIIKTQICYDIDQYHKIFGSSKNYKIDGENLLSIVCFLICRMKPKMVDIYTQINMLKVLFGDDINKEFDEASYLVTTFFSAFEYLLEDQFLKSL